MIDYRYYEIPEDQFLSNLELIFDKITKTKNMIAIDCLVKHARWSFRFSEETEACRKAMSAFEDCVYEYMESLEEL